MSEWVALSQAAQALGVSERTVRRMAARGDLPARKLGRSLVVSRAAVPVYEDAARLSPEARLVATGLRDLLNALLEER